MTTLNGLIEGESVATYKIEAGGINWPSALNVLGDKAPKSLWVKGQLSDAPRVAIVGNRGCSVNGFAFARELAGDLAKLGIEIVSGGACCIGTAAHMGALEHGRTIAVLAGGVENLYPKSNSDLFAKIAQQGALVSEYEPQCPPTRGSFLRRNELIAALADVTVIVDASRRSGAVHVLEIARKLNRPTAAVPANPSEEMAAGCNEAIKRGHAHLVTCARDVIELLDHQLVTP
ncbi:MAG: DNA-processing protein DprA [Actinomycetaceae bacterium]|nr:DNA-processing protein DprA [Actinomycetaceae bacterium]